MRSSSSDSAAEQPDLLAGMQHAGLLDHMEDVEEKLRYLERVTSIDRIAHHPVLGLPSRVFGSVRDRLRPPS